MAPLSPRLAPDVKDLRSAPGALARWRYSGGGIVTAGWPAERGRMTRFQGFRQHRGATALTYGLLIGLVALGALSAVTRIGESIVSLFTTAASGMEKGLRPADGTDQPPPPGGPLGSGASCLAILNAGTSQGDGLYRLDPDGSGGAAPFDAWCDMSRDGGGWTLALRTAASGSTFVYHSPLWTNDATLGSGPPDPQGSGDAKYPAFGHLTASRIRGCLANVTTGVEGCRDYPLPGSMTLTALFRDSSPNSVFFTESTPESWITMWGQSTSVVTTYANGQVVRDFVGINQDDTATSWDAKVRFGLMVDNSFNINAANDGIGFGASEAYSSAADYDGADPPTAVGAGLTECCTVDGGGGGYAVNTRIETKGTLWVR